MEMRAEIAKNKFSDIGLASSKGLFFERPNNISHGKKESSSQVTETKRQASYQGLVRSCEVVCKRCDQSFYTEAGLNVHTNNSHRSSSSSTSCSKCSDCSECTASCGCTSCNNEEPGQPEAQGTQGQVEGLESREFPCKLCDEAFYTQGGLKVHTQHAHDSKNCKVSCENVEEPTLYSSHNVTSGSNASLWESPKNVRTKQRSTRSTKKTKPRLQCEKCSHVFPSVHFLNAHKKKCVQEPETSTSRSCTFTCTTCTSGNGSTCTCSTCTTTSHELC